MSEANDAIRSAKSLAVKQLRTSGGKSWLNNSGTALKTKTHTVSSTTRKESGQRPARPKT